MKEEDYSVRLKGHNLLLLVVVSMLVVLILPTLMRFYSGNDALMGPEPYYHLRAAGVLLRESSYNLFNPPSGISDMTYSPREYFFSPYHYFLVYASRLTTLVTASRIVPFIMGIISVFLFNLILRRFVLEEYKRHIILLLLVLNPVFIYTFTVSNPNSAAICLSLLGIYLFLHKSRTTLFFSALCFAVVSLFSLFNSLVVLVVLFAYVLLKREKQNRFVVVLMFLAVFSLARRTSMFFNYTYSPSTDFIGNLFSDLGGLTGFGIFTVVIAVYGVVSNWKSKGEFLHMFFVAVILLLSLFFVGNIVNMYLMFFVAVAAGIGFVKIHEYQWEIPSLKNLALLILACGIIFSTVSFMTRIANAEPDRDAIQSMAWLRDNAFKDSFVLSYYGEGYLISTIARNPVIADSLSSSDYDQRFFYKLEDTLFYSRDLNDARQLIDSYRIKYIYITPAMKEGLVWSRQNEGLLFLLTNTKNFRKVYENKGTEIWEVLEVQSS